MSAFAPERPHAGNWILPAISIVAGSALAAVPVVATVGLMPPLGLLMLLAWRLTRPDTVRIWAPLCFGLFDDLVSGQPLGSAMLLWTAAVLVIDLLEQRLISRDFWQDWVLAGGATGFVLAGGRLVAAPLRAHVDTILLVQVIVTVLLYPLATRIVALLDRKRSRP